MKKAILYLTLAASLPIVLPSCEYDNPDPDKSVIEESTRGNNVFDNWLDVNYVYPYNIDFKYRMEDIESDMNYTLVPARTECSVAMAHLLKYLCLEAYDEVAGVEFTRHYFPKQVHLIGSPAYNNNGTMVLGVAEGGKKITLYNLNTLPSIMDDVDLLNEWYFGTIHHEFTHILHQTKPYAAAFNAISGTDYVADYWNEEPYKTEFLQRGFITNYAQKNADEDMAEMVSKYITNDDEYWNSKLNAAGAQGASIIQSKFNYIKKYLSSEWGIDIDELRSVILRREAEVISGKIDLYDISLD